MYYFKQETKNESAVLRKIAYQNLRFKQPKKIEDIGHAISLFYGLHTLRNLKLYT